MLMGTATSSVPQMGKLTCMGGCDSPRMGVGRGNSRAHHHPSPTSGHSLPRRAIAQPEGTGPGGGPLSPSGAPYPGALRALLPYYKHSQEGLPLSPYLLGQEAQPGER